MMWDKTLAWKCIRVDGSKGLAIKFGQLRCNSKDEIAGIPSIRWQLAVTKIHILDKLRSRLRQRVSRSGS